ncbi:MAG: hypothetical protein ABI763_03265 [Bacteroidota bacterium]
MIKRFIISSFFLVILSCQNSVNENKTDSGIKTETFEVKDFNALTNFNNIQNDLLNLDLDYADALHSGFVIPSVRQAKEGVFVCSFSVKNKNTAPQDFFYKIYYQDESYKFNEWDSVSGKENEFASENFYGSWENTDVTFKQTEPVAADGVFHVISDSIRILGNPRNEEMFFSNGKNDRWKRNPRVGKYSFLLVVSSGENIAAKKIPDYIQNIHLKNGNSFSNPYSYFLFGEGKKMQNVASLKSSPELKVTARPDLGAGIYEDPAYFDDAESRKHFSGNCGQDPETDRNSTFTQFINNINETMRLENIPVVKDMLKDNYSKTEYRYNESFYKREELVSTTPHVARYPCETVYADPVNKKITIKNPGTEFGKWRKESVGIISRHAFTYGKWRVKCKLTELLNKNNVWNGLTNAIWMIGQSGAGSEEWNKRRICNKEGYMATYWGGHDDKRVPTVAYSEIDFEILKTPPYCPEEYFPPVFKNPRPNQYNLNDWNVNFPDDLDNFDDKLSVSCTNWDMACWEPKNFGVGCNPISYEGKTFETHRWDHWYRALSSRTPEKDDTLFGSPFYYFEIEWKPTEIIWRLGPSPDLMRVVGYMNDSVTSIPNNQMLLIITQEWHNTAWWPGSPYQQQFIPFPKNDILGEIYEVVVE